MQWRRPRSPVRGGEGVLDVLVGGRRRISNMSRQETRWREYWRGGRRSWLCGCEGK